MTDQQSFDDIENLTFLDEEEKTDFVIAKLGVETIAFLQTDLGKLIRGYAIQEIRAAQSDLVNVNAADTAAVIQLQMKASVPGLLLSFINEAIASGEQADVKLRQREMERGVRQ